MASRRVYGLGGVDRDKPNNNLLEQWDLVSGYTAWDANGNVTTQRALTADEVKQFTPDPAIATKKSVTDLIEQALARMQQIIDAPQISFTTVAQAQTQVRQLQTAVVDEARLLRRIVRYLLNDFSGTD